MHDARHVFVDQTHRLEIAWLREDDGKLVTLVQKPGRDAACTVKNCRTGRKSRAPHGKGWSHLTFSQERDRVWLVDRHRPGDRVPGVNPNFVWQECQALPAEILALDSECGIPLSR